jgi:prephenate dehydrogenase
MAGHFQQIGIVGVGLIGGSLGLEFQSIDPKPHVLGIGRDASRLQIARSLGAIDSYSVQWSDLGGCDLVILATPIEQILAAVETIGAALSAGTVVTDVGSTKRAICSAAWKRLPQEIEFIGGHPVAGRELTGVENSVSGLFRDAPYVLCPHPGRDETNLDRLKSLVEGLGARLQIMSPDEHDQALALVSHLPQLLSTALANVAGGHSVSGSGYRAMTRLAGSPYSIWKGILETNADNVDHALQVFIARLEQMRQALRDGSLREQFDRAAEVYRKLRP